MKREMWNELLAWKKNMNKKPLMIRGARQVGKTYIMKEFGKSEFRKTIYINFEREPKFIKIFEGSFDPERILSLITLEFGAIDQDTLLLLDEIQVCPNAITSLKYFNEESEFKNIIAAGSALGIYFKKQNTSYPVGNVQLMEMFPMNFSEFLMEINSEILKEIKNIVETKTKLTDYIHEKALDLLKEYMIVGGYPAAVHQYSQNKNDMESISKILNDINDSQEIDMMKYANHTDVLKMKNIVRSIPRQLGRENPKFKYSDIQQGSGRRELISALHWLDATHIVSFCYQNENAQIPLSANIKEDFFKLYMNDVGMMSNVTGTTLQSLNTKDETFLYRGVITEQFVANEIRSLRYPLIYYRKNTSEIDFLIQQDHHIVPVEVKANNNTKSKSLSLFIEKRQPKISVRFSTKHFGIEDHMISIPLYATFILRELLESL